MSIEKNRELLLQRKRTLLKSGSSFSIDEEKSFFENIKSEPAFMGVIPLSCKLGNYFFLSLDDDGVADYLFWFGCFGYERASAVLFTHLSLEASYVMDLGSYSGYYSLLSSILAKNPNTYAVEANPLNFHRLCENLRLNGSNATPFNYALTPLNENVEKVKLFFNKNLRVLDTGSFVSSEFGEVLPQKKNKKDAFIVPAINLFSLMEEIEIKFESSINSYVLIKLDLEGLEIPLLKDILKIYPTQKIIVFVEILTPSSYKLMYSMKCSRDDLSIAYIDEYAQEILIQEKPSYFRRNGCRNFIFGNTQLINEICSLSPNYLLGRYE
ncbi:FkbM family methyltransferase [Grimontia hollisae]|uniref:FkbM family methyltransferase n=1 Tax=Grimontia hollisae TaxID=673 RepID=UPI001E32942E|nr:FkbM family methyltransferase [Grimontia hollisae]MDF2183166.1 FkbM family methyltransferase [Grimontia hollisae]